MDTNKCKRMRLLYEISLWWGITYVGQSPHLLCKIAHIVELHSQLGELLNLRADSIVEVLLGVKLAAGADVLSLQRIRFRELLLRQIFENFPRPGLDLIFDFGLERKKNCRNVMRVSYRVSIHFACQSRNTKK